MLVRVPYISMTNIIAKSMILPGLIQSSVTTENIESEVNKFIDDDVYYKKTKNELEKIKSVFLEKTNSIMNAADVIVNCKNEKN